VGYHVYQQHGTSLYWYIKTRLESGPVTADPTTTVVYNSKLLINDVKPHHSLTHSNITTHDFIIVWLMSSNYSPIKTLMFMTLCILLFPYPLLQNIMAIY